MGDEPRSAFAATLNDGQTRNVSKRRLKGVRKLAPEKVRESVKKKLGTSAEGMRHRNEEVV